MIVCIPGARRCYQRAWRVDLGCWIYVHNLRDCAKMDEMLRALLFAPHTSHLTPHTSHLHTPYLERRPVSPSLTIPHASHSLPHTLARRAKCLPPHTSSVAPRASQQTIALANMPFSPVPKARGRGRRWIWGPVNDNHYRYRLQTGMRMIIIVIYIHKPK